MNTTTNTTKSFEAIHDDYDFFETHATEAAADIRGYLPYLQQAAVPTLRFLDFGCGPGNFTAQLLTQAGLSPERLRLTLVEPDAGYLQQAAARLQPYTAHSLRAWSSLANASPASFDVILSNHVLYYVPDLEQTLSAILAALARPGLFLASMASFSNALTSIWQVSFALMGLPIPHYTAEDLERILDGIGVAYTTQPIAYELAFRDAEAHRMHILRFLLGPYLNQASQQELLALFDPYQQDGRIVIHTTHQQYVIQNTADQPIPR
jgi:trans-aconitate 2-methyltransferase